MEDMLRKGDELRAEYVNFDYQSLDST